MEQQNFACSFKRMFKSLKQIEMHKRTSDRNSAISVLSLNGDIIYTYELSGSGWHYKGMAKD